jgi:hypothetical protein
VADNGDMIRIKYTYFGDANLDGQVDISDLGILATHWQAAGNWSGGDFDYSGFVDITDLGRLATNWQRGVGNPLGPSLDAALAAMGLSGAPVPEPLAAAVPAGLSLLHLIRRGQRRGGSPNKLSLSVHRSWAKPCGSYPCTLRASGRQYRSV